jgi:hypothetical protein
MAPDIPAGLSCLAVAVACAAVEVILVVNRKRIGRFLLKYYVPAAASTAPRWRWLWWLRFGTFAADEWQDEGFRENSLFVAYSPLVVGGAILFVVFLTAAITSFM